MAAFLVHIGGYNTHNFEIKEAVTFEQELKLSLLRAIRQAAYIPATALLLDTIIYKYVVNLLHVSAFFGHLQGGIQQTKIQIWLVAL
jgi:hypothetical protein